MPPTTCPVFTADEWAERLIRLFPGRWSDGAARKTGAVLYAVFKSIGSQFTWLQEELLYAFNASRIATAEDEALDLVASDFFGQTAYYPATVVRASGEPDDSFRARIIASMFLGGGSRAAISRLIQRLTGEAPRIIEPWNIDDCASLDSVSYVDIDTLQNPGRVSDSGLRAAFCIESILPTYGNNGNEPVYGLDAGLAVDYGYIIDPQPSWFQGQVQMDALLNKAKTLGVAAWRRWSQVALVTRAIGNTIYVPSGSSYVDIDLFPAFAGAFTILAQATWNTQVSYEVLSNKRFRLTFSNPPSTLSQLDWIGAPVTVPGFGTIPVDGGAIGKTIGIPAELAGSILLSQAGWNTETFVSSMSSGSATFGFTVSPPELSVLSYATFPTARAGSILVPAGYANVLIPLPAEITGNYQIVVMPNWNTNCIVTKETAAVSVDFNVAPPADALLYWGIFIPS